jgi:type II secretory pathway component PulM
MSSAEVLGGPSDRPTVIDDQAREQQSAARGSRPTGRTAKLAAAITPSAQDDNLHGSRVPLDEALKSSSLQA